MLTLGEYLRSLPFNGFTSASIGYAFIDTPLAVFAPVSGLYGVSFMVFLLSAAIGTIFTIAFANKGDWAYKIQNLNKQLLSPALLLLFVIALLTIVLGQIAWVNKTGQKISYRLLQTKEFDKVSPTDEIESLEANRLLKRLSSSGAQITATPETALHTTLERLDESALKQLKTFSNQSESHRFLGIPTAILDGGRFNSVVHISNISETFQRHNKVALMPFGEFEMPLFTWVGAALNRRNLDTRQGTSSAPFPAFGTFITTLICNEDATSAISRERIHKWPNTGIILNPTSMQAAKSTYATEQRLQMVQMRALETGRPILRIADHARSAYIDELGFVVQNTATQEPLDLNGFVYPTQGITPYVQWGNTLILFFCVLIMLIIVFVQMPYKIIL
jgi:apolipoprotein N-acyltransferase